MMLDIQNKMTSIQGDEIGLVSEIHMCYQLFTVYSLENLKILEKWIDQDP